ncbi:putative lipid II flippase FtsW [Leucothrix pacifica]|uniref:Probable peptidoglycan glycosyltransferase FtsW n=1 Tax=Leucothrix pacifica TaxID=1247513 RepID=A0A317CAR5_9GAMM|nr:putative lipid II flippase FtsW [Leucothrix pacifica]PWQ95775.1 putative lipid II flippase FtsW [Leucothrix pacifica]
MLKRILADFYPEWERYIDRALLINIMLLIALGTVMMTSASVAIAEKNNGNAYFYLNRQMVFLVLGAVVAYVTYNFKMSVWQNMGPAILVPIIILLVAVLFIGREVNGAHRWIGVGFASIQVSEITKVSFILYMAGYLVRHGKDLAESSSYKPLIMPLLVIVIIDTLLILEPDFGSVIMITATGLALLFLGGVKLHRLLFLFTIAIVAMVGMVMAGGYRMARVIAFLNPWEHAQNKGYQTVHSLMGIGDGGWFGTGLGASVQKLFYLPEAHNDYVFAVLAEEFGFVGIVLTLALFGWLVQRSFVIGFNADKAKLHYGAYVAYGIGFWLGFQVLFHIGVNLAILPPKGLTLPFISYGGSSLLSIMIAMALLMRVHRDTQIALFGLSEKELEREKQRKQSVAARKVPSKRAKTMKKRKAPAKVGGAFRGK